MNENVFDSIDDIDAKLDEEFGKVANEPETEPIVEENVEDTSSDASVKEPEVEPEKSEVVEQPEEKQEGVEAEVSKKDHAFADLRAENGNLKKERDTYKADSDYLKELAASYGFSDVTKFREAVREARIRETAESKGYDYELYKETMDQKQRIAELERQREQELNDRRIDRFRQALEGAARDYSMDEKEILNRLEEADISVEDILTISNPKLILDGVLKDKIESNAKQSQINDLQNMKDLVEDKNETAGNVTTVTIDSLLKDDLAEYKKNNYIE